MMKKLKITAVVLIVLSFILFAGDNLSKLYDYVDRYEMGDVVVVDIREAEISDYTILDEEVFDVIDQEQLELLKDYMKTNDLTLRCGNYEINETYTYEEILEVFKFEEN